MELAVAGICEVSFSHNYFTDEVIKNLSIEPTSASRKLLSNYRIFYRDKKDGFVLLTTLEEVKSTKPFLSVKKNICLSFAVFINDPYFINLSDLPSNKDSSKIFYFSNLNDNVQNSELLLTSDTGSEFANESDLIEMRGQKFTYSGSSVNASVLIEVNNTGGETVFNDTVSVVDGNYSSLIDLMNITPGRFKLYVDGSKKIDFYADSSLTGKNVFGIVDVFISDSVPPSYKLFDGSGNISLKKYKVQFDRRKTFWKYYVVMKYRTTIDPADLSITHPDSSISFTRQSTQTLSDGSTAVPFLSDIVIDLKEETVTGIELKSNNGNSSNFVDIENLPNASVKYSVPDVPNNKVYSEIFVYI